jgi:uncharacterized surface protein with fasciclin (FAS1) repeats
MTDTPKRSSMWVLISLGLALMLPMASCEKAEEPAESAPAEAPEEPPMEEPAEPEMPEREMPEAEMPEAEMPEMDIVETAIAADDFTTLVSALQAAGLVETLKGEGPFTVFAPTDAAFAKLPDGTVATLLLPQNREKLTNILTCHVVSGKVMAADVVKLDSAESLSGMPLAISVSGDTVEVAGSQVVKTDIECSNGVIHVIDTVIQPPEEETEMPEKDIVETAMAAEGFSTLVQAVQAAGLVDTLKGEGPFTVFAPTDDAFGKLPEGTLESLLQPQNIGKLQNILKCHVVSGKVMASDVTGMDSAQSLAGMALPISTAGGGVEVAGASVVQPDIECSNGVIHVIDTVILPEE